MIQPPPRLAPASSRQPPELLPNAPPLQFPAVEVSAQQSPELPLDLLQGGEAPHSAERQPDERFQLLRRAAVVLRAQVMPPGVVVLVAGIKQVALHLRSPRHADRSDHRPGIPTTHSSR